MTNISSEKYRTIALILMAIVAISIATPEYSYSHNLPAPATEEETIAYSNDQLFHEISKFKKVKNAAAQKKLEANLTKMAEKRKEIMLKIMEKNPKLFLRNTIPQGLTGDLPEGLENLIEQDAEIEGTLKIIQRDDFENKISEVIHFIEDSNNKLVRVRFDKNTSNLATGSVIKVKGKKLDDNIVIAEFGGESVSTVTAAAMPLVSGVQKALLMVGNFTDKSTPCSVSAINSTMFTGTQSVDKFYQETSFGNVSFTGTVMGPYAIPYSSTTCNYSSWGTALDNAAKASGIDLTQYSRRVYVLPPNACNAGGYGYIGGTNTQAWLFYCSYPEVYMHELGHNLGMHHARTTTDEYGDNSDPMGAYSGYRHFNAVNMANTSWIPDTNVLNIQSSGTFSIDTTDTQSVNPQVLKIFKPDNNQYYYLGYRRPIGAHNNGLKSTYYDKVNIHTSPESLSAGTMLQSTLLDGGIFQDTINGVKVTQLSHDTTKATVSVELTGPVCARSNPTVSINPLSKSANAGSALQYSVSVINNNSSVCSASSFQLSKVVPVGWTGLFSSSTLSLNSGSSGSSTFTITSDSGAVEGNYSFQVKAVDAGDTTFNTTASATYVVFVDNIAPTVIITSPTDGAAVSGNVTITANASDDYGVNSVDFYIDGKLVATDTTAPYTYTWNTRKLSGTHTIYAKAFDTGNNMATSSTISVTIGSGGGGKTGGGKGGGFAGPKK